MKKQQLKSAMVFRGGRTANSKTFETNEVNVRNENEKMSFRFSLASKGGGITDVTLSVGPDDFAAIIASMMNADRARTLREATAIVAAEVARQSEIDEEIASEARHAVLEAAGQAFRAAPADRNHAERLTRDMVEKLVEKLDGEKSGRT